MTDYVKVYRDWLTKKFEDQNHDMTKTIIWCNQHWASEQRDNVNLREALKVLTTQQKNQVIHELTMGDEVNVKY